MYGKISVAIIMLSLISCDYSEEPILVSKNGIEITIPGYMDKDELADDGIIEYANRYRNFYLVVIEGESPSMDSVLDKSVKRLTIQLKDIKVDTITHDENIAQMNIKVYFEKDKLPIYYFHKILKGTDTYKILTVWIRGEEREEKYKADIEAILKSFKLSKQ